MKYFPAISSTLSPPALAQLVLEKYGGSQNLTCETLRLGVNHTYLIKDAATKYVLRVYTYNWRTEEEVLAEVELLNTLKTNQVGVSYPIPDKEGQYLQRIAACEGERFAVLFSFAEGEIVRNPTEKDCYHLGLEMAKMHQVTNAYSINRKNYDAENLVAWALEKLETKFDSSLEEMKFIKKALAEISSQFEQADRNQLRFGAIHLDVWADNLKIAEGSKITMFDFDNCGNGGLFLDIAYSLMLLFRGEPDKVLFEKKRNRFYEGYESILKISEEEKRLVPYGSLAIWLHYSGVHAQRFDDFTNPFFNEGFLKYWINTVKVWLSFHDVEI